MPYRNPDEQGGYDDGYDGAPNLAVKNRAGMTGHQAASYAKGYAAGKAARAKEDTKKGKNKLLWI